MRARRIVRVGLLALAGICSVAAVVVVLRPLPAPAAGGTCGPASGSETAIEAFVDPVSIGAGAEPASGTAARAEWQAFVGECQAATDARMLIALALLVIALLFAIATLMLRPRPGRNPAVLTEGQPPGWYPDQHTGGWRWWDGATWGERAPPRSETASHPA